eukprot:gene11888-15152_t
MLALVASIDVSNTALDQRRDDADGRAKPDHDEENAVEALRQRAPTIKLALARRAADAGADIGRPTLAGRRQAEIEIAAIRRRRVPHHARPHHRSGLGDRDRLLARDTATEQNDENGGDAEMMSFHGFSNAGRSPQRAERVRCNLPDQTSPRKPIGTRFSGASAAGHREDGQQQRNRHDRVDLADIDRT